MGKDISTILNPRLVYEICVNNVDNCKPIDSDEVSYRHKQPKEWFTIEVLADTQTERDYLFITRDYVLRVCKEITIEHFMDDVKESDGIFTIDFDLFDVTDSYGTRHTKPYTVNQIKEWFEYMILNCNFAVSK